MSFGVPCSKFVCVPANRPILGRVTQAPELMPELIVAIPASDPTSLRRPAGDQPDPDSSRMKC